jgi:hypothetical protein
MKKVAVRMTLFCALALGMTFISIPRAEATPCQLVRITPDRMYAIYDCGGGNYITVMRPVVVQ